MVSSVPNMEEDSLSATTPTLRCTAKAALDELEYIQANSKLERIKTVKEISSSCIQVDSVLGEGSFAMALKVKVVGIELSESKSEEQEEEKGSPPPPQQQQYYALKCLSSETISDQEDYEKALEDLVVEADILSRLHHENIITLHGISSGGVLQEQQSIGGENCNGNDGDGDDDKSSSNTNTNPWGYFLVLDILECNTLQNRLQEWRKVYEYSMVGRRSSLSNSNVMKRLKLVGIGISRGMNYLHSKSIILRDLKPENIGFDSISGQVKLFDFGFARESHIMKSNEVAGSPRYMAPEAFLNSETSTATFASDVFSFGIVLFEICTLQKPYQPIKKSHRFNFSSRKTGKSRTSNRHRPHLTRRGSHIEEEDDDHDEDDDHEEENSSDDDHDSDDDEADAAQKFCWRPPVDILSSKPLRKVISECCAFTAVSRPTFSTIVSTLESEVNKAEMKKQMGGNSFTDKVRNHLGGSSNHGGSGGGGTTSLLRRRPGMLRRTKSSAEAGRRPIIQPILTVQQPAAAAARPNTLTTQNAAVSS